MVRLEDSRDLLVYSGDDGTQSNPLNKYAWTQSHMDYNPGAWNWDTNYDIVKGPLWPNTGWNATIYKCPSDKSSVVVNGVPRPRVRTMAMNFYLGGFAGGNGGWPFAAPYPIYLKLSDIQAGAHVHSSAIRPAGLWVFTDMREDVINWGNFLVNMSGYPYNPAQYQFTEDLPGFYHNQGASFAFADGHGKTHRWLDPRTCPPLGSFGSALQVTSLLHGIRILRGCRIIRLVPNKTGGLS